jgi:hypothetical protein
MADVERVKDLIGCMTDALTSFEKDYSASELLSAQATLFVRTAEVIIDRASGAREGIIAIVQHMQLQLTDVPTDRLKIN